MVKKDDSHEFKPALLEIEERPINPLGRFIFWTVIAVIVIAVLWMIISRVDVVVTARGKIIPVGEIKVLQPLTTGVVKAILVEEGDYVEKDQVLMEIDPSSVKPEFMAMQGKLNYLDLELKRLQAEGTGESFVPPSGFEDQEAVKEQLGIFKVSVQRFQSQLVAKDMELEQVRQQLASTAKTLSHHQFLHNTRRTRHERLENVRDIISLEQLELAEKEVKESETEILVTRHRMAELQAAIERVAEELELIGEKEQGRILYSLSEKRKEYVALQANLQQTGFINKKQQIRAPENGYVNKMFVHTISGVVTPAEKLLSLVPVDVPLVIKARIMNRDVGFVSTGIEAAIKIDTFSFQKYGTISGKVSKIGKDSIADEQLGQVYELEIIPLQTSLMVDGREIPIVAGMTVTAEINVGRRRVIEFFLFPVIRYLDEGLSVR